MDPKSPLFSKKIETDWLVALIKEWETRGHSYFWDRTIEELISSIKSYGSFIEFSQFRKEIDLSKTSKLPGNANKGLDYFVQKAKERIKND